MSFLSHAYTLLTYISSTPDANADGVVVEESPSINVTESPDDAAKDAQNTVKTDDVTIKENKESSTVTKSGQETSTSEGNSTDQSEKEKEDDKGGESKSFPDMKH